MLPNSLSRISVMRIGAFKLANIEYTSKLNPSTTNITTNKQNCIQTAYYSSVINTNPILDQYNANKENKLTHRLNDIDIANIKFERKLKNLEKDVEEFNNRIKINNSNNNSITFEELQNKYENIAKELVELETNLNYIAFGLVLLNISFIINILR